MLVFISGEVNIDAPAGQQLLKSNAIHLRDPDGLGAPGEPGALDYRPRGQDYFSRVMAFVWLKSPAVSR